MGKRVLTSVIGVPLFLFFVYAGNWWLVLGVMLLGALAWKEYAALLQKMGVITWFPLGVLGVLGWPLVAYAVSKGEKGIAVFFLAVMFFLTACGLLGYPRVNFWEASATFWGQIYTGALLSHLILLREADSGLYWAAVVLGVTWASDTFAYFVGKQWGKHLAWPQISPSKTLEGTVGGAIAGILTGFLLLYYFPRWGGPVVSLSLSAALLIAMVIAAPAGDLVESVLKRLAGVKDSGAILPGHGGILDRFDSLLFTLPTAYYILYAFSRLN